MYVRICVCVYSSVHLYVEYAAFIHVCMCVFLHVSIYVVKHVSMHVCNLCIYEGIHVVYKEKMRKPNGYPLNVS